MNTHYIPKLLLRQFATAGKINTYDFATESFKTKKLKNTFAEENLFESNLEKAFASKIEGPMGDLLNNRLLVGKNITINRKENMLLRKFLMINGLRAPIVNGSWEEMVERTRLQDHPSVQARDFLIRHDPELKEIFDQSLPSGDSYISNLEIAMEYDSLEDILNSENIKKIPMPLRLAAQHAMVTVTALWDCEDTGQEFIMPKLPGISMMDQVSIFYKRILIEQKKADMEKAGLLNEELKRNFDTLLYGSMVYPENFSIYPISPTRILVYFSPYFKMYFPIMDEINRREKYPAFFEKEQFDRHFFDPMRMELFEPCKNLFNKVYNYTVKNLKAEEVMALNALLLDMETEEFAFHDYNKIRDSFWFYDKKAKFAMDKKHNFSCMM